MPGLVRAMCEGNRDALLIALDEALVLLQDARTELAEQSSTAGLVEDGHGARLTYDNQETWEITGIVPGHEGWIEEMRDAGRRGGRLRRL